jgi:uncharacterized repeat protein (TIGR03803 family)
MKKTFSVFIFSCYTLLTIAQNPTEFWGTTMVGGSGHGTVFKTDSNGDNLIVVDSISSNQGEEPSGTLTLGTNGKIYAVTRLGGAYNNGTLIECDPAVKTGMITKKIDFNRTLTGARPEFAPVQAANGKLYGTTTEGGTENVGIIYEYDPITGAFNKKFDFTSFDGKNPNGLIKASNNKLYGLTKYGGSSNRGVLFEFDPSTGIFTKKHVFSTGAQGFGHGYPDGNLIQASNGKLYGLGVADLSTTNKEMTLMLFEYDIPADTLIVKFVNYAEDLQYPNFFCGSLVEVPGGKLYGLKAYFPGIFEYDLATSSFEVKYKSKSGEASQGTLTLASNGKLYGLSTGGINSKGTLFEYDYLTATYTTKFDFDGPHGAFYLNVATNKLLEVSKSSVGIPEKDANSLFKMYPNPARDQVTIQMKNSSVNKVSIELMDLTGRSVYTDDAVQVNSENSFSLNIANITQGVYLLKITTLQTNSVGFEKLIKE